ncbi:MAG: ParA family protein [Hyphomicrobiaceae bacterium]|nr:ParA family protein [Hyphomicrobiaceae bacterium]
MIITLASSKGGVGKSTTTAALAGAYAAAGCRTHVIDLDNNHTVSRWLDDGSATPRLSVSVADPQDLTEHLSAIAEAHKPDVTLIDIAGTYERALTVAVARAHLTIIPAGPSEADIFEAARVSRHIRSVFQAFGREPLYRVLLTRVQPLASHAQVHAIAEVGRMKLPLFETAIRQRAAYVEIGLSGLPPHFADRARATVAKSVAEIDALVEEIGALVVGLDGDRPAREVA